MVFFFEKDILKPKKGTTTFKESADIDERVEERKKKTAYAQYPNIEACPSTWPECGSRHLIQWHRWKIENPLDFPKLDSQLTPWIPITTAARQDKKYNQIFLYLYKGAAKKRPRLVVMSCSQLLSRSHHLQPGL